MNNLQKGLDFQTPANIADYMASLVPAGVKTILEPTPGLGNIVSALEWYNLLGDTAYNITAPEDFFFAYTAALRLCGNEPAIRCEIRGSG
ncbi:hypothetical protein PV783_11500 [Chitinophaga sp. CC14]|uniref:hypothetical protein n=1 Tax=Chitinophaga sp. CC14 TaxID=3029199 RepID=UPI003B7A7E91